MVTVSVNVAGHDISTEVRSDAFLKGIEVSRLGERYRLQLGPGLRVEAPLPVIEEAVQDLLMMLPEEGQRRVLQAWEEARL